MKKILIGLVISLLTLSSCCKDDFNPNTILDEKYLAITGTWENIEEKVKIKFYEHGYYCEVINVESKLLPPAFGGVWIDTNFSFEFTFKNYHITQINYLNEYFLECDIVFLDEKTIQLTNVNSYSYLPGKNYVRDIENNLILTLKEEL